MNTEIVVTSSTYTGSVLGYILTTAHAPDYGALGVLGIVARFIFGVSAGVSAAIIAMSAYQRMPSANPLATSVLLFVLMVVHVLPWRSAKAYFVTLASIVILFMIATL